MGSAMLSAYKAKIKIKKNFSFEVVEKDIKKTRILKKKHPSFTFYNEMPSNWNGTTCILAVKPQIFNLVSIEMKEKKIRAKYLISIMAGISTLTLKKRISFSAEIIRAMPNKSSEIMMGVTCLYSKNNLSNYKRNNINKLFNPLGNYFWIRKETLMDAVTAISGSGPAYFFLFINALIKIAKGYGFKDNIARELVIKTASGALEMTKSKSNILKLIEEVKSPGGTTEAALNILEKKGGESFLNILQKAVNAAKDRSVVISKRIN